MTIIAHLLFFSPGCSCMEAWCRPASRAPRQCCCKSGGLQESLGVLGHLQIVGKDIYYFEFCHQFTIACKTILLSNHLLNIDLHQNVMLRYHTQDVHYRAQGTTIEPDKVLSSHQTKHDTNRVIPSFQNVFTIRPVHQHQQ